MIHQDLQQGEHTHPSSGIKSGAGSDPSTVQQTLPSERRSDASPHQAPPGAAAPSSSRMADLLATAGWSLEIPTTPDGKTMLHWTAMHGKTDLARMLLDARLDVNAVTQTGSTPLHLAAENGHQETIELLLAYGADPTVRTQTGETPLYYAARKDHEGIIGSLLAHGVDIDAPVKDGMTLLHRAASEGLWSMIEVLLRHGAAIDARTPDGRTALWFADRGGYAPLAELLILQGADARVLAHMPAGTESGPRMRQQDTLTVPLPYATKDYSRYVAVAMLVIWLMLILHGFRFAL